MATLSYNALAIGPSGAFGYFAERIVDLPGVTWHRYTLAALALTTVLGRRQIDISARMIGVLIASEILILAVMDLGIFAHKGAVALPAVSFEPSVAFGTGLGAALTFAFPASAWGPRSCRFWTTTRTSPAPIR
ncbi:hypothetical protein ACFYW9_15255 [Streptomyces sp. NPDC002698]|uniref:hypothetical protein n=1 Tax=Streptomyces sp. NPDC002698 TaxID=3364660 RepID=UPI0036AF5AD9